MKKVVSILAIMASCAAAMAQNKHNLFVDLGVNERSLSATYARKLTKHLELGGGLSTLYINSEPLAKSRTAIYGDIRPYWRIGKKSMVFAAVDVGAALILGPKQDSTTLKPVGLYTALSFGYQYRINKRGMGPYLSFGMYGTSVSVAYDKPSLPPAAREYSVYDAYGVLALGFKF